ncbi:MAG: phosphotransferase family protein [Aggregatilineaceae bacterium]
MNSVLAFLRDHRERLALDQRGVPPQLVAVWLTPRFQASRHVIAMILPAGSAEPVLVAKVPRLSADDEALAHEAAILRALERDGEDSIPQVIAFEAVSGFPLLVETALVGPPMDRATVRRDPQRCCEAGLSWLLRMATPARGALDDAAWERLIGEPLATFAASFPLSASDEALLSETLAWAGSLRGSNLPLVLEHGDLSHPNLILLRAGGLGVVDWELARLEGVPGHDLFFFLTYIAFARRRAEKLSAQVAAFREAFFGPEAWATGYLARYAQRLGLTDEPLKALFVLCWARYTCHLWERVTRAEAATSHDGERAAWLRANRHFVLWQEALRHAQRLTLA